MSKSKSESEIVKYVRDSLIIPTVRVPGLNKKEIEWESAEPFQVFSVSAFHMRDTSQPDEEFGLYSIHEEYPNLIGESEIWVAEEARREWSFFVFEAINWIKYGYEKAILKGRDFRNQVALIEGRPTFKGERKSDPPEGLILGHYMSLPGGINVWLADGELIRQVYKTDFVEGGNSHAYPWMPDNTIWLTDCVPNEYPFILFHEYFEYLAMQELGWDYDHAHERASFHEFHLRKECCIR